MVDKQIEDQMAQSYPTPDSMVFAVGARTEGVVDKRTNSARRNGKSQGERGSALGFMDQLNRSMIPGSQSRAGPEKSGSAHSAPDSCASMSSEEIEPAILHELQHQRNDRF